MTWKTTVAMFAAAPLLLLTSCDDGLAPYSQLRSGSAQFVPSTFEEWCVSWQLRCPSPPPADVPDGERPWTLAQWQGLLASVRAVADSPSRLRFTRAELDDARLVKVAATLDFGELLTSAKARIDAGAVQEVRLADGAVTLTATGATSYETAGGLVLANAAVVSARVSAPLTIAVSGVTVSGGAGQGDAVRSFQFTAPQRLRWDGDTNSVDGVPVKFFLEELAGISLGSASTESIGYPELAAAVSPLVSWLTVDQREINFSATEFDAFAKNLPALVDNADTAKTLRLLLTRLQTLRSTAASRADGLVQLKLRQETTCIVEGQAQLTLEPEFGIVRVAPLGEDGSTLQVYGIKAKPLTGLIRPTLRLGRVDLEPSRVVIHDVPVLGTFPVDADSFGKITCT